MRCEEKIGYPTQADAERGDAAVSQHLPEVPSSTFGLRQRQALFARLAQTRQRTGAAEER